jgi:hypothetical protein
LSEISDYSAQPQQLEPSQQVMAGKSVAVNNSKDTKGTGDSENVFVDKFSNGLTSAGFMSSVRLENVAPILDLTSKSTQKKQPQQQQQLPQRQQPNQLQQKQHQQQQHKTHPTMEVCIPVEIMNDDMEELDMGSPAEHARRPRVTAAEEAQTQQGSAQISMSHKHKGGVIKVLLPVSEGVEGEQATQYEQFKQMQSAAILEIDDDDDDEEDGLEADHNKGFTSSVLSSCRKSVSLQPQTPESLTVQHGEEDDTIDFTRVILAKTKMKNDNNDSLNFQIVSNPFQRHVHDDSDLQSRVGSVQSQLSEQDKLEQANMEIRNKELNCIIRLLESGVKDTRYEDRRRIMDARRCEEDRLEKQRKKYARDCDACLQGILNRMDPVLGEKVAVGLRQRQDRRELFIIVLVILQLAVACDDDIILFFDCFIL